MSRWSEQYEKHAVHETVDTLRTWLDVEIEEIDSEHEAERRRLNKALDLIHSVLAGLDTEIFPLDLLNNLNNQLRQAQIWNQINSYSSAPNIQNLRAANDYLSGQLSIVYQIAALARPPEISDTVQSVEDAYGKFCKLIEAREKDFENRLTNREAEMKALESDFAEQKTLLENLRTQSETTLSEWQSEFGAYQNSRAEDFSAAQILRGEKFDDAMREIRASAEAEAKDISGKHDDRFKAAFDTYSREAEGLLTDVEKKHAAILEIHGLVGEDGVAGGYQKGASDEHDAANRWRIVAMVSLGLAAAWLLLKFYLGFGSTPTGGIKWAELATATSLTLVLLATAGYASRQSKIHRDAEQQMRWFALEVKAIDPFLSSLSETDQMELKKQLSERLFGKDRTANQAAKAGVDVGAYKELTESIMSPVKEIAKMVGKSQ